LSDDSVQSGWDALFGSPAGGETGRAPRLHSSTNPLERYLELPGVRGVLRVALEGTILGQAGEVEAEQDAALAAFLGAAGGQLGQVLGTGALQYATVAFSGSSALMLLLRQPEAFLGLLLDRGISPTHVISRLQEMKGRP
jgi:predicted regulator of Ras-like GTPase activity (Roadblock/LC7/MglB family)